MYLILIELAPIIAVPLYFIVDNSLQNGSIPDEWKDVNVTAVFKKGSKQSVGNYRPVISASHVSKVFESIIRNAIIEHLYNFNLVNSSQDGFVKNKS